MVDGVARLAHLSAAMTEEDYARYIRELKNINTILRLVADGQLPLHECWVRIAASRDRMQGRAAQHSHQDETGNAKRHAMTAGPSSPVSARVSLDPGLAHSSSTSAKITFELEVPRGPGTAAPAQGGKPAAAGTPPQARCWDAPRSRRASGGGGARRSGRSLAAAAHARFRALRHRGECGGAYRFASSFLISPISTMVERGSRTSDHRRTAAPGAWQPG